MIRFLFPGNVLVYLALLIAAWWTAGVPGIVFIVGALLVFSGKP